MVPRESMTRPLKKRITARCDREATRQGSHAQMRVNLWGAGPKRPHPAAHRARAPAYRMRSCRLLDCTAKTLGPCCDRGVTLAALAFVGHELGKHFPNAVRRRRIAREARLGEGFHRPGCVDRALIERPIEACIVLAVA